MGGGGGGGGGGAGGGGGGKGGEFQGSHSLCETMFVREIDSV